MRILFFVAEDWYFITHRLSLARALKDAGHEVFIMCNCNGHESIIPENGLHLIPINLSRNGCNILKESAVFFIIINNYRKIQPNLVHQVAMKPVLYGSIAAWVAGIPHVVNAMVGLGFLHTTTKRRFHLLRTILNPIFRASLNRKNTRLIVQNSVDAEHFAEIGVKPNQVILIRGAGVDLEAFSPHEPPEGSPVVMLASRMLWQKGVGDFVEAARILQSDGVDARFVLAGNPDVSNPSHVPYEQLQEWNDSGIIEWIGLRNDMPDQMARCSVFCLPTYYREGVPKVILEAAASGLPIVTTDSPGCRDVVHHDVNGLHVPPKNPKALALALKSLLEDPERRSAMGLESRRIVENRFSLNRVISEHLALYDELTRS